MDNGVVSVVIMKKIGMVLSGVMEYLKSKISILLAYYDGAESFGEEFLGPGFDRGCNSAGFEQLGFGLYDGQVLMAVAGSG